MALGVLTMAGDKPSREDLARMAGDALLDAGAPDQLNMFGDDKGAVVPVERRAGPGRPAGSGNRIKAKLRDYMAAQGYRDPAAQLAMLAGLDRPDLHPLGYAAQIAATLGEPVTEVAKLMRQAAADLMPYWHAKLTPDVSVQAPAVNIGLVIGDAAGGLRAAPDGTVAPHLDPYAPLDVRLGIFEQDQSLGDDGADASDSAHRTE
ncbi:hypothetical protein MASR1M32_10450 [Rhodobacter sp.]